MTSTLGSSPPRPVDLLPPTLQTIPEAIAKNIAIARARTRARIMAVVKADGYGHGAVTVARAATAAGAAWLGTTDIAQAMDLRTAGFTVPILTWLNPSGVDAEAAATGRIDVAVGSVDELEALLTPTSSNALRVHLHIDTGMAREGCPPPEWDALIARARQAQRQGKIRVVGVMGHLPLADHAVPEANTPAVSRLRQARSAVIAAGLDVPLTHLAATSATLTDPATHFGMVRFGAGLVGIDPSETTELHSASRLTAPVAHSAAVNAGTPVGYGGTYVTDTTTNLSVLPSGTPTESREKSPRTPPSQSTDDATRWSDVSRWTRSSSTPAPTTFRAARPRPCSARTTGSRPPSATGPAGPGPFPTPSSPVSDHE